MSLTDDEFALWLSMTWREKAAAHFLAMLWGQFTEDFCLAISGREAAVGCGKALQGLSDRIREVFEESVAYQKSR